VPALYTESWEVLLKRGRPKTLQEELFLTERRLRVRKAPVLFKVTCGLNATFHGVPEDFLCVCVCVCVYVCTQNTSASKLIQNLNGARCQRLTPVILATQESEIGRILVQGHPGQSVCETLSPKQPGQSGLEMWLKQ
jgi:hypothetical protein